MKIRRKSPLTGEWNEMDIDVTENMLERWRSGELIQRVMPRLTASEREFIMTGYTDEDWDAILGEEK